jgi:hypothetical protein
MKTIRLCPECGSALPDDAPEGLCPQCLVKVGFASQPEPGAAPHELPGAGQHFGGYRIVRELGRGGMGAVYDAEHLESGRRVALKVLSHQLDSPEAHRRFLREGRLAASINHPNSVYIYGTEEIDGTPAITMELIAGGTLQERVQRGGPMPVGEAVDAILQVIAGLEAAQAIGILHRDVKPANCFQDADGTVKVGDFGLSISTAARGDTQLTMQGQFLGTPAFCSPEQLRGEELNLRSDMYSVGVTLFFLLTGRTPFEGRDFVRLLANVLETPAPSPGKFRPDLPPALADVVGRCLQKTPGDRFKHYDELRQALAPFGSDAPVPAPLGLRFVAGAVDTGLVSAFGAMVGLATGRFGFSSFNEIGQHASTAFLPQILLSFSVTLIFYALCEGLWGASPGKALCRLRVTGPNRHRPGVARALGRALIFLVLPALPFWIMTGFDVQLMLARSSQWFGMAIGLLHYALIASLFSTARRHNGFAAIQDLLTGTRVIRKPAFQTRPAMSAAESAPPETENRPKIGPYHIIETLEKSAEGEWLLGYDTRLLRKAWIRTVPPGTPPIAPSLRNLGRIGRLRWISGRREGAENWDAFEGVAGGALPSLLVRRHSWNHVRFWLLDLATEISAAQKDGTLPAVLAPDRVWITADGRAKLLDFPAPGCRGADAPQNPTAPPALPVNFSAQEFLHEVTVRALSGPDSPSEKAPGRTGLGPLPLQARQLVESLRGLTGAGAVLSALKPLMQQMAVVTRTRRAGLVAACVAFPLVAGIGFLFAARLMDQWVREQPQVLELQQLLSIRSGQQMALHFSKQTPKVDDRAFAIHIAGHYRQVITNPAAWSNILALSTIQGESRRFAEQAVTDHPQPTEQEVSQATALINKHIPVRSSFRFMNKTWMPPFVAAMCLFVYVCVPALIASFAFRGGLALRALGLAIVRKDGTRASRLRLFWRSLVTWSPVLCAPIALALLIPLLALGHSRPVPKPGEAIPAAAPTTGAVASTTNAPAPTTDGVEPDDLDFSLAGMSLPPGALWGIGGYALLMLGLTALSVALPGRSLQDRIAGTCLVPR